MSKPKISRARKEDLRRDPRRGFSLIEVLLSVALIGVITGVFAILYVGFQMRDDLDIATNNLVQALHRAEVLSRGASSDSGWGVAVQAGSITIFEGQSYASRNASLDEVIQVPSTVVRSSLAEVDFSKFTGFPLQTGTTTFVSANGETRNANINSKGVVNY